MNSNNTKAFYFLTMVAFSIAFLGMVIGILRLEADLQTKGFFAISYIFSTYTTFSLAKVIRDKAEAAKLAVSNMTSRPTVNR